MAAKYAINWDLDVFFPGGSSSPEFRRFVEELTRDVGNLERKIQALDSAGREERPGAWSKLIDDVQELGKRLRQAGAFVSCLTAQNVKDEPAKLLRGRLTQLYADYGAAMTQLERRILE
ncbi:MAG: oligoendopeptidase, partial [Planifilum fimeticola]